MLYRGKPCLQEGQQGEWEEARLEMIISWTR